MDLEQVTTYLSSYKENAARAAHLRAEIKHLERLLAAGRVGRAAAYAWAARAATGLPSAPNASDRTGVAATCAADGLPSPEERALARDMETLQCELARALRAVALVKSWLGALSAPERVALSGRLIDGLRWTDVAAAYARAFGHPYTTRRLMQLVEKALGKIARVAA